MRSYGSAALPPAPSVDAVPPRAAASSSAWLGETQEPFVNAACPPAAVPSVPSPATSTSGEGLTRPALQRRTAAEAATSPLGRLPPQPPSTSARCHERSVEEVAAGPAQNVGRSNTHDAAIPVVSPGGSKASSLRSRPPLASRLGALRATPALLSAPALATASAAGFPASSRARRVAAAASTLGPNHAVLLGGPGAAAGPDPLPRSGARGSHARVRFADAEGARAPPQINDGARAGGGAAAAGAPRHPSLKRRRDEPLAANSLLGVGQELPLKEGCATTAGQQPQLHQPPHSREDAGYTSEELEA